MKKRFFLIISIAILAALIAVGCGSSSIKMATGGTTGTYYAFCGVISQVLADKTDLTFDVQSTGASMANIRLVANGEVDMAIVQNDVMDYAYNGTDLFEGEQIQKFSAMAGLYAEVCQIVANPKAGIKSIADLKGKRVSVGDAGSGVEVNSKQILEAYGITFDDITVQNLGFGDSANALKDDKIDAFFCTAGAPTTAIMDLTTTNNVTILSVDDEHAAKLIEKYPFYTQYSIPSEVYGGKTPDAKTVAVKATFIVSNELSEDTVYKMTKTIFENTEDIATGHAKGNELDLDYAVEGISVPFHPGAEKYFKEAGVL